MIYMRDDTFFPWSEIVSMMYDRQLDNRDYRIVKVLYSTDSTKRCVVSENQNMYTYELEVIERLEDDEWRYICDVEGALPAQWVPFYNDSRKSLFDSMDELMKELVNQPEYKKFFI